jgi:hypothetical protein
MKNPLARKYHTAKAGATALSMRGTRGNGDSLGRGLKLKKSNVRVVKGHRKRRGAKLTRDLKGFLFAPCGVTKIGFAE